MPAPRFCRRDIVGLVALGRLLAYPFRVFAEFIHCQSPSMVLADPCDLPIDEYRTGRTRPETRLPASRFVSGTQK